MKNKITLCTALLIIVSHFSYSQCSVTIVPQGPTTFCQGDSIVLVAQATGASATIDQSQLIYNAGTSARNLPGYSVWQSFTAGMTGTLTEIDMGFFNAINGMGYWSVHQGTGYNGALLDSQTVNVVCGSGNCLIPFTENIAVVSGTTYTFAFRPGAGIVDPYGVQAELPGTYAGGYFGLVDPSGTTNTGFDMIFETKVRGISYLWSNSSTDTSIVASTTGNYSVTITTPGCTHSANVNVTEIIVDTAVTVAGTTLHSTATSATYQWVNCNTHTAIAGATNQSYTATANGYYEVVVTQSGCTDTSMCYHIASVDIAESTAFSSISISPNPSTGKFIITNSDEQYKNVDMEIVNILGEIIFDKGYFKQHLSNEINLTNYPSGIYFVRIISEKNTRTLKLIRE